MSAVSAPEPAYRLDEQVGFVLRQVQQRHTGIFAAAFGDDMTPTQWSALVRLAEAGECSQNHLGRLIATDVATIKGIADRLIRRGLVETRADPADRRRLLLRLTEAGHDAYRTRAATALDVSSETLAPLSKTEQATLLRLLDRLR
ncbi:MarR family winged helix-turn-helix transcriptional regulator [Enterovirga rhinocerotis]|uniref:DNA-binding MarR family transcriptional regulator n=1 Tax=Enterovirga rhinocerotis TaxID=1339210 RepID=A0A4R7C705_9HYPH|nr:MarR family winged helix-turn-helix transcriptional regulator [Enterovirga rhinocerotis]TDR93933.1 DNA-binding MarR family transcriptional regulator [Enterovirga rhinocerotis]